MGHAKVDAMTDEELAERAALFSDGDTLPAVAMPESKAAPISFDYGQIDEGIRDEVKQAARSIRQLEQGVITGILAIGKRLIEVKDMIPHGQFTAWVMGEFGMQERTAQRMMSVAKEYSDPQKRQTLSLFSPSVAYMLAAPSTPEEARAEIEQAAAQGQKVTVEDTKEAIAAAQVAKAAAPFAPVRPQKAKAEPVSYAPVRALETCVKEWLSEVIGEGGAQSPDTVLSNLSLQAHEPVHPQGWMAMLVDWIVRTQEDILVFQMPDLLQAINNVADQRQVAANQARARTVYDEPTPAAEPVPKQPIPPDPRLGQAQLLRYMLMQVREMARRDYGDLTGRHTDLLIWERDTEALLEPLESLIAILSSAECAGRIR